MAVKRRARKILLIVAALIASSPAFSETLRCGSSLVQPGVTVGFVQEKCGPPKSRETFSEPVMARRANGTAYEVGTTSKEVWRYQRGNGSFPALLTFEGGVQLFCCAPILARAIPTERPLEMLRGLRRRRTTIGQHTGAGRCGADWCRRSEAAGGEAHWRRRPAALSFGPGGKQQAERGEK